MLEYEDCDGDERSHYIDRVTADDWLVVQITDDTEVEFMNFNDAPPSYRGVRAVARFLKSLSKDKGLWYFPVNPFFRRRRGKVAWSKVLGNLGYCLRFRSLPRWV